MPTPSRVAHNPATRLTQNDASLQADCLMKHGSCFGHTDTSQPQSLPTSQHPARLNDEPKCLSDVRPDLSGRELAGIAKAQGADRLLAYCTAKLDEKYVY